MAKKKTAYSILELAVISQGDSVQKTLHNALKVAQEAEMYNYHRIWFAEHHNSENIGSNSTTLLMGYVAENTKGIRVGSGGIMLPNHSPLIVAEQFATLAHLYPNRIDMGLGRAPGTDQATAMAIRSDFMQAAQSFPGEIAKIEQYFSVENKSAKVRVPIAEGVNVPMYILGSSTDSAHLAAEKGLPYAFASHFASTHLQNALRIYKEEFQPSDVLQKPYTMAGVNVIVADTDEEAQAQFTSLIRMFIGLLSGSRGALQPPTELTEDLKQALQHPALHQMLKYSFVGSVQSVKTQVQAFLDETGVDELIATTYLYRIEDRLKSVRLFAEVMEEVNRG